MKPCHLIRVVCFAIAFRKGHMMKTLTLALVGTLCICAQAEAAYTACVLADCVQAFGKTTTGEMLTHLCSDKGTCPTGTWPDNPDHTCKFQATATQGTFGTWERHSDADEVDCCMTCREDGCDGAGQPCNVSKTLTVTREKKWTLTGGTTISLNASYSASAKASIGGIFGAQTGYTVGGSWEVTAGGAYERSESITQQSAANLSAPCCGKTYYDAAVWTRTQPATGTVSFKLDPINCKYGDDVCHAPTMAERTVTDAGVDLGGANTYKRYVVCDLTCATYNADCHCSETTGTMEACGHTTLPPE